MYGNKTFKMGKQADFIEMFGRVSFGIPALAQNNRMNASAQHWQNHKNDRMGKERGRKLLKTV